MREGVGDGLRYLVVLMSCYFVGWPFLYTYMLSQRQKVLYCKTPAKIR